MQFTDNLVFPGEHQVLLQGLVGPLEAVISIPENPRFAHVAFLGHPHSLQGGTMNNKVVTTMARVFKELGIPSLRLNFRGVGQSAGEYNAGIGESADLLLLAKEWQNKFPQAQFFFAGFSFGSYVTYRCAAQFGPSSLISIAPPVHHYDYHEFQPDPKPWLIVQGNDDEVVPANLVIDFAKEATPPIKLIPFAKTTHFFHGKLVELKDQLLNYVSSEVITS
ncbi:MAG: hypothetical protein EPN84_02770 [Legionella sp.]|nr:MAG: hypothetical protein EPN84_02770 [Legionella sp.]